MNIKKRAIIAIIVFACVLLSAFVIFNVLTPNDKTNLEGISLGDPADCDETDPENVESDENGAEIKSSDLLKKEGLSNGIDVSKWQGKIDWQKVKADGIEFAFIRIGFRGENGVIYRDENADYNIQQAQKAGVLVGVYFFSTAVNEGEAKEEADWTVKSIEGYSISYPVVYDCEGFQNQSSRMNGLTATQRTKNALAFLERVSSAGYDTMLYGALSEISNPSFWDMKKIQRNHKVWIAQYSSVTYPAKQKPDYTGECDAWQYTNKGTVAGVNGSTDMVVCYFNKKKAAPKNASAAPDNASVPLTEEDKKYAAVNETVTAKQVTNLRDGASTKSNIVATIKNGEQAVRIGVGTNGWSKLTYNGQTVYAISSYLTTDIAYVPPAVPQNDIVAGNTFKAIDDSVTAKQEVNLRSLPSSQGDIVGVLKSGEFLKRTAVSDKGYSRLTYNGQTVYAVTNLLSNEVVNQVPPPTSSEQSDGYTKVDEQVTAKTETNLRSAPSTQNSQVVYLLKNGENVQRIGTHTNGWSKLVYNGQIVYAVTSYLQVSQ